MMLAREILAEATRLRGKYWGWSKIACHLCVSHDALRRALEPEYGERRNIQNKLATAARRGMAKRTKAPKAPKQEPSPKVVHATAESIIGHIYPIEIPERVLFDRERRRELSHPSFTASWQGDPLPGYSALDRRRTA